MFFLDKPLDPSAHFFLQLTLVLVACRAVGWLAKYIGQPPVVGEMIAGVLLGPSLFGWLQPDLHRAIFPDESMPMLYRLSQLGLALYMFVVGVEFNVGHFRAHGKTALAVSLAGMVAPFFLGAVFAIGLYYQGGFFPSKTDLFEAMLFVGAAMSITAFPMLARIILENRLTGTSLGTLTLAAGAIDDVAAWSILALILSYASNSPWQFFITVIGGVAYTLIVFFALKPWLHKLTPAAEKRGQISSSQLAFILGLVMLGAFCANTVGIHSVFGAFILGCAMPRGVIADSLSSKIEPLTLGLLVPLFFTYSGLNTRLDLVCTPWLMGVMIVALIVASLGKGVACWAAARWAGEERGAAMAVGCLMNARGMMGLITLILGKENGIIGPELFSILVLVTILTTLAATPTFRWVYRHFPIQQ